MIILYNLWGMGRSPPDKTALGAVSPIGRAPPSPSHYNRSFSMDSMMRHLLAPVNEHTSCVLLINLK